MNQNKPSIKLPHGAESLLKIALSQVPIVGTALTEGLFDYWGRVKQDRINTFVEMLQEYFESISGEKIDEEYLRSADLAQFCELVLRKVGETKSKRKLEIFKNILIGRINNSSIGDYSETFLNLVAALHERQIEILKVVSEFAEKESTELSRLDTIEKRLSELSINNVGGISLPNSEIINRKADWNILLKEKEELVAHIEKVSKEKYIAYFELYKGEILDVTVQDLISKGLLQWIKGSPGLMEFISITNYGKKLLEFIKGH